MREDYEHQEVDLYYKRDRALDHPKIRALHNSESKVLNVGCGRAETVARNLSWIGVDFNKNLIPLWRSLGCEDRCFFADAKEIPFPDQTFDYTVSCDFLEHVDPKDLDQVVRELLRVGFSGLHVIHLLPESGFRGVGGRNLHLAGNLSELDWREIFFPVTPTMTRVKSHLIVEWG